MTQTRNLTIRCKLLLQVLRSQNRHPMTLIGLLQLTIQKPPCWRASSFIFPHWDIKTKASQASLVQVSLFMSQCGNNNELALQHGQFCTTWSLVAKGLLHKMLAWISLCMQFSWMGMVGERKKFGKIWEQKKLIRSICYEAHVFDVCHFSGW